MGSSPTVKESVVRDEQPSFAVGLLLSLLRCEEIKKLT